MVNFSLKTKIAIFSSSLVFITATSIALYFYKETSRDLLNLAYKDLGIEVRANTSYIETKFQHLKNNIQFLSRVSHLQGIIRASSNGGIDPESGKSLKEWKAELSKLMANLARSDPDYLQVRLLGFNNGGKEIVRADRLSSGAVHIISDKDLQSKSDTIYFQEILNTSKEFIYFSSIDLNREFGEIVKPRVATIRAGTLVYDNKGNPFGFVMINLNLNPLFDRLRDKGFWLINGRNQFLVHSDRKLEFKFEEKNLETLKTVYPTTEFEDTTNQGERFLVLKLKQESGSYSGLISKIIYDPDRPDRSIGLIRLLKSLDILSGPSKTLNHVLMFVLGMVVLAILLSWVISYYLTRNIDKLTRVVEEWNSDSKEKTSLPLKSKDETGVLARVLFNMRDQLRGRMQSLAEEKAQLSAILNSMVDAQITINAEGLVLNINKATERMFGYSNEDLVGKNINILMPEPYRSEHDGYIQSYLETGIQKIIGIIREVEGLRKDGSVFPVELSISECNIDGKRWFTGIVRDISKRKEIEETLAKTSKEYQIILGSMGEGVYTVDLEGRTTFINPKGLKLLGYTEEEMLGSPQHSLIHHSFPDGTSYPREECPIYNAFKEGKEFHVDNEVFWKKNGSAIPVDYLSRPVRENGEIIGAVITFRDNSEKQAINSALKDEQERNRLLKEVAISANAANNPDDALHKALSYICEYAQWPVGHVYKVSEGDKNLLVPSEIWWVKDKIKYKSFIDVTSQTVFKRGVGLPGRVLESAKPAWIENLIMDTNFPRAKKVTEMNLKGGFAFPIIVGSDVVAVLEFFSEEEETPNPTLLSLLFDVGIQLGIVIKRHLADRALLESEQKMKGILDNTTAVIYLKDLKGKYLLINNKFEELFKISNETIIGKTDFDIFPEKCASKFQENDKKVLQTIKPLIFEEEVLFDNKKETYLSVKFPLKDSMGEIYASCGISTNITDRINYESKLVEAQQKAEEANIAKSSFLANMSHEIRTPMNAIMGMAHLVLQTPLNKKQKDYIEKILVGSKSLLTIINDILDFSKIESGKLQMEEVDFDLGELICRIANFESLLADKKGIELIIQLDQDIPNLLKGDPVRLGQVLTNLINNAIKFTPDGEILVQVGINQINSEGIILEFAIQDTGIGLTQEQIDKLFQPFNQADLSTTRKYGGTGLGLSICRRIVKLMGGAINVKSKINEGSCFFFTAKFKTPNIEKEQTVIPEELKNMPVLLLEPNETNQKILRELLQSFSFQAKAVGSGKAFMEALSAQTSSRFSLVIINWKIPDFSPDDLVSQIYKICPEGTVPKVLLMRIGEETSEHVNEVCADGILNKPIFHWSLYNRIMEVLGKNHRMPSPKATGVSESIKSLSKELKGKVLVVEDNEINQQVARELLENMSLKVSLAENGKVALQALQQNSYDLIFMDLQMPVMDGYKAVKEIRKNPDWQSIPIIAMTASALVGEQKKVSEAGMNDYLSKPADPAKLVDVLMKWLPGVSGESLSRTEADQEHKLQEGITGLDQKSGLARLGGNEKLYVKLLLTFADNNLNFADKFQEILGNEDWEKAKAVIHNLKSTSGNIGANEVYNLSQQLEKKLNLKETSDLPQLTSQLFESLKTLLKSISKLDRRKLHRPPEAAKLLSTSEIESIQSDLQNLKQMLIESDSEALEQIDLLGKTFEKTSMVNIFMELQKKVHGYNFEQGLGLLEELYNQIKRQEETKL